MATKILVNYPGSLSVAGVEEKKKSVADALCVCPEDVIILPGLSVSVVDIPDELAKERVKADKAAAAEQEKAKKEQEAAEIEAIKAQTDEAVKTARANEPVDYDSWTLADLHEEASRRDIHGRSGLDKAGLVKALTKADKKG